MMACVEAPVEFAPSVKASPSPSTTRSSTAPSSPLPHWPASAPQSQTQTLPPGLCVLPSMLAAPPPQGLPDPPPFPVGLVSLFDGLLAEPSEPISLFAAIDAKDMKSPAAKMKETSL